MQFHPLTVQTCTSTLLGTVRLAASPAGLCGLWFDGQRHLPHQLDGPSAWPQAPDHPVLRCAAEQLQRYLCGDGTQFDLPLDMAGVPPKVVLSAKGDPGGGRCYRLHRGRPPATAPWPGRSAAQPPCAPWAPPWGATP